MVVRHQGEEEDNEVKVKQANEEFAEVRASEIFPKPEGGNIGTDLIPFAMIPGEGVRHVGKIEDSGFIYITNYRLHVTPSATQGILNVPIAAIENIELRNLFQVQITCKYGRIYRIAFVTNSEAEKWFGKLTDFALMMPERIEDVFALGHLAWAKEEKFKELMHPTAATRRRTLKEEVARLRYDLGGAWRISNVNKDYKLCTTYPEEIVCPQSVTDKELEIIASYRSANRIPAVVWRNVKTGAVLARCSQPAVGWLGWRRCTEDENYVSVISQACSYDVGDQSSENSSVVEENLEGGSSASVINDLTKDVAKMGEVKKVMIVDARSYAAAVGNMMVRGGGVECQEYYPNADIVFMNLGNIHNIRKSFQQLSALCNGPAGSADWFHALEATKWFTNMSGLLKAALTCAKALEEEGRPVIVHCSDGWDRTPQIVSLAEIILDPYYRTIVGFQTLVEKEWFDFGHKMADRCGNPFSCSDNNERSPIFLQWLDCVHQLLLQFPCHFEFNISYLIKLGQHLYSNLFGNFLCNSQMERKKYLLSDKTRSIWDYFVLHPDKFRSYLYRDEQERVIWPKVEASDMLLWKDMYFSEVSPVSSRDPTATNGSDSASSTERHQSGSSQSDSNEGGQSREEEKTVENIPQNNEESNKDSEENCQLNELSTNDVNENEVRLRYSSSFQDLDSQFFFYFFRILQKEIPMKMTETL